VIYTHTQLEIKYNIRVHLVDTRDGNEKKEVMVKHADLSPTCCKDPIERGWFLVIIKSVF
jgi:hypothetical protein